MSFMCWTASASFLFILNHHKYIFFCITAESCSSVVKMASIHFDACRTLSTYAVTWPTDQISGKHFAFCLEYLCQLMAIDWPHWKCINRHWKVARTILVFCPEKLANLCTRTWNESYLWTSHMGWWDGLSKVFLAAVTTNLPLWPLPWIPFIIDVLFIGKKLVVIRGVKPCDTNKTDSPNLLLQSWTSCPRFKSHSCESFESYKCWMQAISVSIDSGCKYNWIVLSLATVMDKSS